MSHILMIVTGANSLTLADGTEHPTGFWAEELVVAHRDLTRAGHTITLATPGGVRPTVDAGSLAESTAGEKTAELTSYLVSIDDVLAVPTVLADVHPGGFDAVVIPGGHGPMTDLAFDEVTAGILKAADDAGTIIAPFCHGPAALLSTRTDSGFTFAGRRLTVFTDDEERQGGTGENTPWFVEDELRKAGAIIQSGPAWSSHVVIDGNLISGQNPQSSAAVTAAVVEALAARG
ncbi:type 1 glutamine amidotransferase domain-containing protein [Agromyces atrinae]|uniref:type 1 glutamine amidotransferase domain-containing protein n=1 Tax=Agromyces atrinae TaxID=592376 RepID=UPI001F5A5AC0|nr:type 1 glutamine amidotransferase domain-containing protein [Agromyces atrinae]MCI2957080.1 type 1 glutamine amidotransferase domain-containing protein [Agromyces atrinae]